MAAQQPDTDEVATLLDDALTELGEQHAWQELVVVLRQIRADLDEASSSAVDNLDPVSAAIARRAMAAIAGDVIVDSTAWRVLTEET